VPKKNRKGLVRRVELIRGIFFNDFIGSKRKHEGGFICILNIKDH
jgi:hypothetical protein